MNPKTIYFQSKGYPEFRFLSNFHMADFTIGKIKYPSVEHFYQSSKAVDEEKVMWIVNCIHPAEAMRRGRTLKLPDGWNTIKLDVMKMGVRNKFEQNKDLIEMLLATEGFELVEFAPWGDTFWGVGKDYVGENNLGKILMQVREELKGKS